LLKVADPASTHFQPSNRKQRRVHFRRDKTCANDRDGVDLLIVWFWPRSLVKPPFVGFGR